VRGVMGALELTEDLSVGFCLLMLVRTFRRPRGPQPPMATSSRSASAAHGGASSSDGGFRPRAELLAHILVQSAGRSRGFGLVQLAEDARNCSSLGGFEYYLLHVLLDRARWAGSYMCMYSMPGVRRWGAKLRRKFPEVARLRLPQPP
jgi:hypothetical protein